MAKKRILIIDDVETFCKLVRKMLELMGDFNVDIATDGKRGIKLAKRLKPDLILLDIIMPGIDGLEVLKRLKEDIKTMSIPVVMLTGDEADTARRRAEELGNEGYLTKPIKAAELNAKVKKILKL